MPEKVKKQTTALTAPLDIQRMYLVKEGEAEKLNVTYFAIEPGSFIEPAVMDGVGLADEPTASLDAKRGRQAVEMIRNEAKKRGKAAVAVTHDERILDLIDKIYPLENGKLML